MKSLVFISFIIVCATLARAQQSLDTLCNDVPRRDHSKIFVEVPISPRTTTSSTTSIPTSRSVIRRLAQTLATPSAITTSVPPTSPPSSSPIPLDSLQLQCNAMFQIYNATSSCGWLNSNNYRTDATDCCSWFGATCDANGWLTSLDLSSNNVCGSIADVNWSAFPYLLTLDFRRNALSGALPDSMSAMSNLQYLYMSHNYLSGAVPSSIGKLSNLVKIYLNNNLLNGTLPSTIANLSSLQQLDLHQNYISGALPNLAGMQSLQMLFLYDNELTSLPVDGWSSLSSLFYVDVTSNKIDGCLPSTMVQAPFLSTIEAPNNFISCLDFQGFFNNPMISLTVLVLSDNLISGTAAYLHIPQKLIYVDLSRNNLTGWELGATGYTSQMIHLDLSFNQIVSGLGDVQAQVNFNYLSSLDVSNNNFTGCLPPAFNQLTKLDFLNITNSGMSRPIGGSPRNDSLIFGSDSVFSASHNFHCYKIFLDLVGFPPLAINVNNEYFRYDNCRCNEGFYGVPPLCTPCLTNAICPGDELQEYIYANQGSYALPDPGNPKIFIPCSETPSSNIVCNSSRVLEFPPTPENFVSYSCAQGYTGRFCSACDHDSTPMYFKAGDVCAECFGDKIVMFLIACYVLGLVGIMIYVYINTKSSESDLFSIVMFLIQTVGIVTRIGLDTPKLFQASTGGFSVSNFRFIGVECLFPDYYNYFGEVFITFLIPISFSVCVVLVYYIGKLIPRLGENKDHWKKRNQKALLLLLRTCYLPSAKAAFQALVCTKDALGERFVLRYQNVSCSSFMYTHQVLPLAVVMAIVFIMGYPLFLTFFFFSRKQDIINYHDMDKDDVLRFLVAPFRPTRFYWGIVILLRSLFLAIVVSSISFTNVWLPLSVCIVLLSSFILHTLLRPYKDQLANWVEGASLTVLILLFVLTLGMSSYSLTILTQSGDSTDADINSYAAYALLLLCVLVVLAPAIHTMRQVSKYVKENRPFNRLSMTLKQRILSKMAEEEKVKFAKKSASPPMAVNTGDVHVELAAAAAEDGPDIDQQELLRRIDTDNLSLNKGLFWGMS